MQTVVSSFLLSVKFEAQPLEWERDSWCTYLHIQLIAEGAEVAEDILVKAWTAPQS